MYQELYRNINGEDYGDIFGYVADNFDQLEYYCEVQDFYNKEDVDLDRYKGYKFGIIVSLHIDELAELRTKKESLSKEVSEILDN